MFTVHVLSHELKELTNSEILKLANGIQHNSKKCITKNILEIKKSMNTSYWCGEKSNDVMIT